MSKYRFTPSIFQAIQLTKNSYLKGRLLILNLTSAITKKFTLELYKLFCRSIRGSQVLLSLLNILSRTRSLLARVSYLSITSNDSLLARASESIIGHSSLHTLRLE